MYQSPKLCKPGIAFQPTPKMQGLFCSILLLKWRGKAPQLKNNKHLGNSSSFDFWEMKYKSTFWNPKRMLWILLWTFMNLFFKNFKEIQNITKYLISSYEVLKLLLYERLWRSRMIQTNKKSNKTKRSFKFELQLWPFQSLHICIIGIKFTKIFSVSASVEMFGNER